MNGGVIMITSVMKTNSPPQHQHDSWNFDVLDFCYFLVIYSMFCSLGASYVVCLGKKIIIKVWYHSLLFNLHCFALVWFESEEEEEE